jgi:hypothetical protein
MDEIYAGRMPFEKGTLPHPSPENKDMAYSSLLPLSYSGILCVLIVIIQMYMNRDKVT